MNRSLLTRQGLPVPASLASLALLATVASAACGMRTPPLTRAELEQRDAAGLQPLHRAARDGQAGFVRSLLDAGANVESPSTHEWTPLYWAVMAGDSDVVELLLDRGAQVNARAEYDMSPLHWAALLGREHVVRLLAERGADLGARNIYGMTPLFEAANRKVVKVLIAAGADLTVTDDRSMTPLHLARSEEVALALIDAGANITVKARDGRTPVQMYAIRDKPSQTRIVVHPGNPLVRLRGETTRATVTVRNVSSDVLTGVKISATGPGCRVSVEPQGVPSVSPAQMVTYLLNIERTAEGQPGEHSLHVTVTGGGPSSAAPEVPPAAPAAVPSVAHGEAQSAEAELTSFNLRLDTRREHTLVDDGMMRLGQLHVRPPATKLQWLVYVTVPLLLLGAWWVGRRFPRRAQPPPGASEPPS